MTANNKSRMLSLRRTARDPVRILRELVAIPSVHPEADSDGTIRGEAAVGAWVAEFLRAIGADVAVREMAPGRPTVIGVFEPSRRARATVVFAPHLDTVGVANMEVAPFKLTARGRRLHGRGSCDTKGPMAAMLAAIGRWIESDARRDGSTRWIVAATAGEEQGSLGARALMRDGFRADFALALEPTELRVVYAAKGLLRVWLEVPGKAAHGSKPERGINAVYRALPLVGALRDKVAPLLASRRHPVLGGGSLNLGVMQGGGELNLVPAACRIGLDIRLHPGWPASEVLSLLRTTIAQHAPSARLVVEREGPSFVTERSGFWTRRLRAAGTGWATADWFCDANIFSGHGIPSVAFGPGSIAQAHTRDEFILRSELDAGVAAFSRFLASPVPIK